MQSNINMTLVIVAVYIFANTELEVHKMCVGGGVSTDAIVNTPNFYLIWTSGFIPAIMMSV